MISTRKVILFVVMVAVLLCFMFPYYWMLSSSLKPSNIVTAYPPVFIFEPTLDNFRELFRDLEAMSALTNSLIIVSISTMLSLIFGSMAAYALGRFDIKGKEMIALEILLVRMVPPIVSVIPLFILAQKLGLLDTHAILIAVYTLGGLPVTVWIMRVFIEEIPRSIEEAAMIDGCNRIQALFYVTLPLMIPGMAATVVIVFMFSWNEYLYASLLTSSDAKTLPVMAALTVKPRAISFGLSAAAGILMSLPVIILALSAQKYLVRGLTFGMIKG